MTLNFMAIPSLQNAAAVAVVGQVWKQPEARSQISSHNTFIRYGGYLHSDRDARYQHIKENVLNLISSLSIPDIINAKLSFLIKPMGYAILDWMKNIEDVTKGYVGAQHLNAIVWTMRGTINETETFKSLSDFSPRSLYKLACKLCMHDYVLQLWCDLEEKDQKYFTNECSGNCQYLISFWSNIVMGKSVNIKEAAKYFPRGLYDHKQSVYVNMFKLSVKYGYFDAMMHFWNKLTDKEVSANIFNFLNTAVGQRAESYKYEYLVPSSHSNILFFLLSQVDDESKIELIQKQGQNVLLPLMLDWPWQEFFTPTVNLAWNSLSNKTFLELVDYSLRHITESPSYEIIFFKDFWDSSTPNFKNVFLKNLAESPTDMYRFFKFEDLTIVKLLLIDAELEDRVSVIFNCIRKSKELLQLIYNEKYFLLDALFQDLSLELFIEKLKRDIILDCASSLCSMWLKNDQWSSVEVFLNWVTQSVDDIMNFKKNIIDIKLIAESLIIDCKYDVLNAFLQWVHASDDQLGSLKREISEKNIGHIIYNLNDWSSYELFSNWCFNSEDLRLFKQDVLTFEKMQDLVYDLIVYTTYNFEFAHKLVLWRYDSELNVIDFKVKFILNSDKGLEIFQRFLSNYKVYDSEYSNWTLIRKYTQWCYPMSKTVIRELKETFSNNFDRYFHAPKCGVYYNPKSQRKALFYLLDTFALKEEACSTDVDMMDNYAEVLLGESLDEDSDSSNDDCGGMAGILAAITDSEEEMSMEEIDEDELAELSKC